MTASFTGYSSFLLWLTEIKPVRSPGIRGSISAAGSHRGLSPAAEARGRPHSVPCPPRMCTLVGVVTGSPMQMILDSPDKVATLSLPVETQCGYHLEFLPCSLIPQVSTRSPWGLSSRKIWVLSSMFCSDDLSFLPQPGGHLSHPHSLLQLLCEEVSPTSPTDVSGHVKHSMGWSLCSGINNADNNNCNNDRILFSLWLKFHYDCSLFILKQVFTTCYRASIIVKISSILILSLLLQSLLLALLTPEHKPRPVTTPGLKSPMRLPSMKSPMRLPSMYYFFWGLGALLYLTEQRHYMDEGLFTVFV